MSRRVRSTRADKQRVPLTSRHHLGPLTESLQARILSGSAVQITVVIVSDGESSHIAAQAERHGEYEESRAAVKRSGEASTRARTPRVRKWYSERVGNVLIDLGRFW